MNLHFRSFDRESHSALFRQFELVRSEGILSWKHSPLLVFLRQRLFGFYKEHLICPHCGHQGPQEPKEGLMREIIFKIIRRLEQAVPARSKSRWMASLHERV